LQTGHFLLPAMILLRCANTWTSYKLQIGRSETKEGKVSEQTHLDSHLADTTRLEIVESKSVRKHVS